MIREVMDVGRSEEHTSELQSRQYLVCRLLLEKKIAIYRKCNLGGRAARRVVAAVELVGGVGLDGDTGHQLDQFFVIFFFEGQAANLFPPFSPTRGLPA